MESLEGRVRLRVASHFAGVLEKHGRGALALHEGSPERVAAVLDREFGLIARCYEFACEYAGDPGWDRLLVRFACDSGEFFALRGRYTERVEWAEAGLAAAERVGDAEAPKVLLLGIASAHFRVGRYSEALVLHQRVYDSCFADGDERGMAVSLFNVGRVLQVTGEFSESLEFLEESLRLRERIGDAVATAYARAAIGDAHNQLGAHAQAEAEYLVALDTFRAGGNPAMVAGVLNNLGTLAAKRSDFPAAVKLYRESLEIAERLKNDSDRAILLGNLGNAFSAQGRADDALEVYREALTLAERLGDAATIAHGSWNLGALLEELGQLEEAEPLVRRSARWCDEVGHPETDERLELFNRIRARLDPRHQEMRTTAPEGT